MKKQAGKLLKWRIHQLEISRTGQVWSTPVERHARTGLEAVVHQFLGMKVEAVKDKPDRYTAKPIGAGTQFVLEIICQLVKP